MGGKSCFRLSLHLNYFFQDHRSICRVFVSKEMNYIKDLKNHIANLFDIEHFYLMCLNNFLPDEEDVRILQLDDTIVAVPISIPERDVNIPQQENAKGTRNKDEVKKKRKKRKVSLDDIFGTESEVERERDVPTKKKKKAEKKSKKTAISNIADNADFSPSAKSSPMVPLDNSEPADKDSAIAHCSGNSVKIDSKEPSPDFVNKVSYFEKLNNTVLNSTSNMPEVVVTPPEGAKRENASVRNESDNNQQKLINVLQMDTFHSNSGSQKSTKKPKEENTFVTPQTAEISQAPKKFSIRHNVTPFKPVTILKSRTNIVKNIIKYKLQQGEQNESRDICGQSIKEENNSKIQNEEINNIQNDSQISQNVLDKTDSKISQNVLVKTDSQISQNVLVKTDSQISQNVLDKTDSQISQNVLDKTDSQISQNVLEKTNSQISQNVLDKTDSQISQNINEYNSQNFENMPNQVDSSKNTTPKTSVPNHNDNTASKSTATFVSPKPYDKNLQNPTVPSIGPSELDFQVFRNLSNKSESAVSTNDDFKHKTSLNLTVPCSDNIDMVTSDSVLSDNTANSDKFITKRKRTRVRRRKKKNVEEVSSVPPQIVYKPPKTQAAPISHVRFEDEVDMNGEELPSNNDKNEVTEYIEIEDEGNEDEEMKLAENNDVVIIESESENQQSCDNSLLKLIKGKDRISIFSSEVLSASISEDIIARCPPMDKLLPQKNDVIVFKILKITLSYTPELSSPITAKVSNYNSENGEVQFTILEGKDEFIEPQGKFSIDESEEATSNIKVLKWTDLIEPRLLFP